MKKIYYLEKHPVKIGDVIEHNGFRVTVTEELIKFNPELFVVENPMKELLDKAKRDYPVGTVFNSKYGAQKVLGDEPFMGRVIEGIILINTDQFPGGGTIYTPEDGWAEILHLKFTTEDGVGIYGDMKTYAVAEGDLNIDNPEIYGGNLKCFKYFYHRENALAYIEKHRKKTLKDYESALHANKQLLDYSSYHDGTIYNVSVGLFFHLLKANEPKLYYSKILQLIADDLNDGWAADFSDNKPKWYVGEDDSNWIVQRSYGFTLFKTKGLADKARAILGDKVKYLFK